mgnify:CR=1 FL=1
MKTATLRDSMSSVTDEGLLKFFKQGQQLLEDKGEEDAAFYFEQCADYIQRGGEFYHDSKTVARMFGL